MITIEFTLHELKALNLSTSIQLLELKRTIETIQFINRDLACITYNYLSSAFDKIKENLPDE